MRKLVKEETDIDCRTWAARMAERFDWLPTFMFGTMRGLVFIFEILIILTLITLACRELGSCL